MVERSVLISRCRPDGGQDTIADTYLSISPKGRTLLGYILPDGIQQPHHALLNQIFAVAPCEKIRAGTNTHQTIIPHHKSLFCDAVA